MTKMLTTQQQAELRGAIVEMVKLRLQEPMPTAQAFEFAYADVCETIGKYVGAATADDAYSMRVPITDDPADYLAWNIWPVTLFDRNGNGIGLVTCELIEQVWGVRDGSDKCEPWPEVRSRLRALVSMALATGMLPNAHIRRAQKYDPDAVGADRALPLPPIDLTVTVNVAAAMKLDAETAQDAAAVDHLRSRLRSEGGATPGAQRVLVVCVSSLMQSRIGMIPLRASEDGIWRTGDPQPLSDASETVAGALVPNPLAVLDNGPGARQ